MGKLLALAIIAVITWYVLTQGLPWLKTELGAGPTGGDEAGESEFCIAQASAASDSVADELVPAARPPIDSAIWGTVLLRVAGDLAAAERACACPTAACGKALDAVMELRAVYDGIDNIARGNPMGMSNPARNQERANELLNEARQLARSG
jgi:hypothetical protein